MVNAKCKIVCTRFKKVNAYFKIFNADTCLEWLIKHLKWLIQD